MAAKVKQDRGAWWVVTHFQGKRRKKRVGSTKADKRKAERIADEINARLAIGVYQPKVEQRALPFEEYARNWFRSEVQLPVARGIAGALSPATAELHERHVRLYLTPFFGRRDLREIRVPQVQSFYDHCLQTQRPPSERSVEMVLATLRRILAYAEARDEIGRNPIEVWKKSRGRRRRSAGMRVETSNVLSADELNTVLGIARRDEPNSYPLFLFLADTGTRIGEALALRWIDVDLDAPSVRICRSYSSGKHMSPTKTGQGRTVELSGRLVSALGTVRPQLFGDDALVFPNENGGLLHPRNFRSRAFQRVVRRSLGTPRRFTPHGLRHTFASLHMARSTPLKWIQAQGGWASAKMLLDTYGHYLPDENEGHADALTDAPKRPYTAPTSSNKADRADATTGRTVESRTTPGTSNRREWSARPGSNRRQPAWEAGTLPTELLALAAGESDTGP